VLIKLDRLSVNIPGCTTQKMVLLSEQHNVSLGSTDRMQLSTLEDVALKKDKEALSLSRCILIETPCMSRPFKVTTYLQQKLSACKNITTRNIEIRCIANAACYMLSNNPYEINPELESQSADKKVKIGDLTFSDLHKEFEDYQRIIRTWLDNDTVTHKELTESLLPKLMSEYEDFNNALKYGKIEQSNPILQVSKDMLHDKPRERSSLASWISSIYSRLFELYILKCICSSPQTHITLIAGQDHSDTIRSLLIGMGSELLETHSNSNGLEEANLDIA